MEITMTGAVAERAGTEEQPEPGRRRRMARGRTEAISGDEAA